MICANINIQTTVADDDDDTSNFVKAERRGPSQEDEVYSDDEQEHEARAVKRRSGRLANSTPRYERYGSEEVDTPSESVGAESELVDDKVDDNLEDRLVEEELEDKLKGYRYTGMGLFDSANDKQKKNRNQKKPAHVLETMAKNSLAVSRDYQVWEAGELRRTRDIYATPSVDGSPVC